MLTDNQKSGILKWKITMMKKVFRGKGKRGSVWCEGAADAAEESRFGVLREDRGGSSRYRT